MARDLQGPLLDFDACGPLQSPGIRSGERIKYVHGDVKDRMGLGAVLVRPDGVVAWACNDQPDVEQAAQAAAHWFAPPNDAHQHVEIF